MTKTEIRKAALELSEEDRLALAEELLESVAPDEREPERELHAWQRQALEEALDDLRERPEAGLPFDEAMRAVREEVNRRG